jgi:hypothetical protein
MNYIPGQASIGLEERIGGESPSGAPMAKAETVQPDLNLDQESAKI